MVAMAEIPDDCKPPPLRAAWEFDPVPTGPDEWTICFAGSPLVQVEGTLERALEVIQRVVEKSRRDHDEWMANNRWILQWWGRTDG